MNDKSYTSPVLRLPLKVDSQRLSALFEESGIYNRMAECNSVSLVHRNGAADPWMDGVTPQTLSCGQQFSFSEGDFSILNPGLPGSYFQECHQLFKHATSSRVGRIRLFSRHPQTSSSLHRDLDVRLHLALASNQDSFLVFPQIGVFHIPSDDHIYMVDTTRPHFAVNTHTSQHRIHLVCNTYCGFREERTREGEITAVARELFKKTALTPDVDRLPALACGGTDL